MEKRWEMGAIVVIMFLIVILVVAGFSLLAYIAPGIVLIGGIFSILAIAKNLINYQWGETERRKLLNCLAIAIGATVCDIVVASLWHPSIEALLNDFGLLLVYLLVFTILGALIMCSVVNL